MKKITDKYIDSLVKQFIKENVNERADDIMSQINELGGMEDSHPTFGKMNLAKDLSKMSDDDIENLLRKPIKHDDEEFEDDFEEEMSEGDCNECGEKLYEVEFMRESDVCECGPGSMMSEGMCMECGLPKMDEGIYDVEDLSSDNDFDYIEEEDDVEFMDDEEQFEPKRRRKPESEEDSENSEFCRYQKRMFGPQDERYREKCTGKSAIKDLASMEMNLNEKLHGGQRKLDRNHNGRIDAEDFKMLRKGSKRHMDETDMEEGNAFTGKLADARKHHKDEFELDGKKYDVREGKVRIKESVILRESELITLIENIILEKESRGLKAMAKPKGMSEYERAYKGSGKENKDYLESVVKKMKDYLKDGHEGDFEMDPKDFPMSNRELKEKKIKGFNMSKEGEDFIDDYLRPGMENISYDEIHPDEKWMEDIIGGSSRTGNSDGYANSVKTDVNKKLIKKQKAHKLDILSKKAANKSTQPVFTTKNKGGYSDGDGVRVTTNEDTVTKKDVILIEEFDKIKNLMSYNRKTQ
jgi:hypothetical protein